MTPRISLLIIGGTDPAIRRTVASVGRQRTRDVQAVVARPAPEAVPPVPGRRTQEAPRPDALPAWVDLVEPAAGAAGSDLLEAARAAARGTYVGVLAAGDELEPGALAAVSAVLEADRGLDVLYTDEQWPGDGASGIATKPDWLPTYLLSFPYLGRLCLVRAELLEAAGGFRAGFDAAEEWDAQLRVTELTDRVGHAPVVAVTRAEPPPDHPVAQRSGAAAVQDRVARSGRGGSVETTEVPLGVRVWWHVDEPPLVSLVVPTAGGRRTVLGEQDCLLVERCLRSVVERTVGYDRWEVVLVTSEHTPDDVVPRLRRLLGDRLVEAPVSGRFNFSRSVNEGARVARGDLLLLLNDDTEVLEPRWLQRLVSVAADPGVGAVGAKLLFEEGTIQHLGIVVDDDGGFIHALGSEPDGPGRFGTKQLDMEYVAVTGACLLTPAQLFRDLGGFTTELPLNFNDVDYCFKVLAAGRRVVSAPFAVLHHFESSSRGHALEGWEEDFIRRHWGLRMAADPHVQYRSSL